MNSVSQEILLWGFLTLFPKRLGIFSSNFTSLLYVPIYARHNGCSSLTATYNTFTFGVIIY